MATPGQKGYDPNVWQDREIRFDAKVVDLEFRPGEVLVESLDPVEDTKGNNGESGEMLVTNIRIIWVSKKNRKTNISIGFNCVTALSVKDANSRLKGKAQAMFVLTKYHNQRFEFIFTSLGKESGQVLYTVQSVFKSYDGSRLYRDLKLRGAIIRDKELALLPLEETYSRVHGVMNLSSEQGNLGTFFISNVRVVWYANAAENFNVSMPYMQMRAVKLRESKFGQVLVIETTTSSGGYILGFRVDPKETLDYVYKEINSLFSVYAPTPIFGVQVDIDPSRQLSSLASMRISSTEEDVEITDQADRGDTIAQYYADSAKTRDREPVYCPELGLAIEQLKDGMTIEDLWSVV